MTAFLTVLNRVSFMFLLLSNSNFDEVMFIFSSYHDG